MKSSEEKFYMNLQEYGIHLQQVFQFVLGEMNEKGMLNLRQNYLCLVLWRSCLGCNIDRMELKNEIK